MARRHCFALDLVDDAALIAEYEARHAPGAVWPAVLAHIAAQGVEAMEIWRTGDRMVMIAEVADDYPRAVAAPAEIAEWETLMWRFQRALPHAVPGEKWVPMQRIFAFGDQQ
ncbi:L-rhamnose mutarotase [Sphingomonas psychrotolerans]|uniref:L-fucose mutarotase n=1 Tax=Sphingomonas psychrotolerans TaxID=1327635 RepID=A0A2K8ME37_9SPHN|nr:L-rhamnose mutarotase [Sphingomonas psychrotolerans]ATY30806.1 L-fucose mutarotase [Sphingomonas psychrotolerans]